MGDPPSAQPPQYEIRVRGHLDDRWRESFAGLELTRRVTDVGDPQTVLRGPVTDEAALHGLLARIRDLGIPLLLVRRTPNGDGGVEAQPSDGREDD